MISSTCNSRIRGVQALLKKRSEREKQHAFVIEGLRILREAPPGRVKELYVTEAFLSALTAEDRALIEAFPCGTETVTPEVMERLSDTVHPQGALAVVRMRDTSPDDLFADSSVPPLILVTENLQDPGNLGTILRTGEAAGVTGILLAGDTADPYNPKVVRSTMGSIFRLPFLRVGDIKDASDLLKRHGVTIYAADLRGADPYDKADYRTGCAFLIGNEGAGLTATALSLSDARIRIPMAGSVESLNAGVSAALLCFEAARQRR